MHDLRAYLITLKFVKPEHMSRLHKNRQKIHLG